MWVALLPAENGEKNQGKAFKKTKGLFIERLFTWYESNKRVFSWRRQALTPYQVLILEILLQRTPAERVETILDKFFAKYPNPRALSRASENELKSDIETLGLQNRRVTMLRNLAFYLVEKHGGRVPEAISDLLNIPGVGIYVANAILCFSIGKIVPLIDTNIARVLGRVFGLKVSKDPSSDRHLWAFARRILPKTRIKQFNWALIDLGSLICRPRDPLCHKCPLCDVCTYRVLNSTRT